MVVLEDLKVHLVDEVLPRLDQEEHLREFLRAGVRQPCTRAQGMEASTIIRTRSGCIIRWGQDLLHPITTLPNILVAHEVPKIWVREGVLMTHRVSIRIWQPQDLRDRLLFIGKDLVLRPHSLEAPRYC